MLDAGVKSYVSMSSKIIKTVTQHFFYKFMTVHLSLENFFLLTSSTSVTSPPTTFLPITKQKLKSKFKLSTIFDLNFQFEFLGREEFAPIIIKGLDQSLPSQARTSRY